MSKFLVGLAAMSACTVAALLPGDASACGGCFHPENDPEITVVTGHRMAFAISPKQTVLWDQVEYSGSPKEFAWVLPIKPGARLELANNAWFEALDAATSTRVIAPQLFCSFDNGFDGPYYGDDSGSGCGCGDEVAYAGGGSGAAGSSTGGDNQPPPVTVVQRETVGPYDVVTLSASIPGVLTNWLATNGFAVDPTVSPIIDQYQQEGFDFIAMRLQPEAGIQNMKPVRVVSPGASPVLPLRMVSAGTGANTAVTLFIIGEGRWEAKNLPNGAVAPADVTWDYLTSSSDYAARRLDVLAGDKGRTWITPYAHQGALLSPVTNSLGFQTQYIVGESTLNTINQLIVSTGLSNNETYDTLCAVAADSYADSNALVVDPCADGTGGGGGSGGSGGSGGGGGSATVGSGGGGGSGVIDCGEVGPGEIDARTLACAGNPDVPNSKFDDLSVALTGMHPSSVWVTRLEANLSRAGLELDLELQASANQATQDNWLTPGKKQNVPCVESAVIPPEDSNALQARRERRAMAAASAALVALALAFARRAARALAPSLARSR